MLLSVNMDYLPIEVKGDRSKPVLFYACKLPKALEKIEETMMS